MITIEMLTEGVYFESRDIWGLPFSRESVRRAFRNLNDSHVIKKYGPRGKYLLTDTFLRGMKDTISKRRPSGNFVHYPDFAVFDICGLDGWSEDELEVYVKRLREHWLRASGARADGSSLYSVD